MSALPQVIATGLALLMGPGPVVEAPMMAAKLRTVVSAACEAVRPLAEDLANPGLEAPLRMVTKAGVLYLPRGFRTDRDGAFDLLVHFHGSADLLGQAMEKKGMRVALLTSNHGVSSSAYEWPHADAAALDRCINAVAEVLQTKHLAAHPHARRVGLSAWSAGHGAVYRMLSNAQIAERVNAVLLEDALHAAFLHPAKREIDDVKMAPFLRFAREAAEGKKLFAITHSSIPTFQFASTTETSTYLARALGAPTKDESQVLAGHMNERRSSDLGGFHMRGFDGMSKEAHCDHFREIGDTVLGLLAARWSNPPR